MKTLLITDMGSAEITNGKWKSKNKTFARLLNSFTKDNKSFWVTGPSIPDPDKEFAEECQKVFGGDILYDEQVDETKEFQLH